MKTYIRTTRSPMLVISNDEYAESPRANTNLGFFITQTRNYKTPDIHTEYQNIMRETGENAKSPKDHLEAMKKAIPEAIAIYPFSKYEHGSVVYRLGTSKGFDSCVCGFYIITTETQNEVGVATENFEQSIANELETYSDWCNGEVYQYTLYNSDGTIQDSCGGFIGDTYLDEIKNCLPKEWEDEELSQYCI